MSHAYIDGFNLYFGLKAKYGRKYLWLDLQALATSLLRSGQTLQHITYFIARIRDDLDGEQRQSDYLDALIDHSPLVTVVDGRFQEKDRRCRRCGATWTVYEEKETDVNIAIALVEDAMRDRYDTALLISADSDLCPAIRSMKRLFPEKRIVVAFPPRRRSGDLKKTVDGFLSIGDDKIRQSQLPQTVVMAAGITLHRPKHWN
ncbi:MAG: NYN domain-containing protein [Pseudonocardiaceae bacterium]